MSMVKSMDIGMGNSAISNIVALKVALHHRSETKKARQEEKGKT